MKFVNQTAGNPAVYRRVFYRTRRPKYQPATATGGAQPVGRQTARSTQLENSGKTESDVSRATDSLRSRTHIRRNVHVRNFQMCYDRFMIIVS